MNDQTNQRGDRLPEARSLTLERRVRLTVTEVSEVLRVEETGVALRVGQCVLMVRGAGLKLRELRPEGGRVEVLGSIDAIGYEAAPSGGLLRRLFG